MKATLTTCHTTNESDRLDRDEDAEDEENVDRDLVQYVSGTLRRSRRACRGLDGPSDTEGNRCNQRQTENLRSACKSQNWMIWEGQVG